MGRPPPSVHGPFSLGIEETPVSAARVMAPTTTEQPPEAEEQRLRLVSVNLRKELAARGPMFPWPEVGGGRGMLPSIGCALLDRVGSIGEGSSLRDVQSLSVP